ncbi:hypothetical protein [Pseudomonas typographi]|uniref:hypothetical protein n=1 Tax=Pseudomonas typographi TaxID=2715964 RepID=UPI001682C942|nr:hypothetical protein [Pseudomonas typographi]MBD1585178.1 hypothetical protein [Pseudomonas typographi]
MNFFDPACQTGPHTAATFGLCDDENGSMAYVDTGRPQRWIATVNNRSGHSVTFTAIDKCVIQDAEHPGRGRCDAMLTTPTHLYLVELKNQRAGWIDHALAQLESTLAFLVAAHDVSVYSRRKAYACNKRHPHFVEIEQERKLRVMRRYGFRLDIQASVVIVD